MECTNARANHRNEFHSDCLKTLNALVSAFRYKIEQGKSSRESLALAVASEHGMPAPVLARAQHLLSQLSNAPTVVVEPPSSGVSQRDSAALRGAVLDDGRDGVEGGATSVTNDASMGADNKTGFSTTEESDGGICEAVSVLQTHEPRQRGETREGERGRGERRGERESERDRERERERESRE